MLYKKTLNYANNKEPHDLFSNQVGKTGEELKDEEK
jgi:hypothetical protein